MFLTSYTVYTTQNAPKQVNDTCVPSFDKDSPQFFVWVSLGRWVIFVLALLHMLTEVSLWAQVSEMFLKQQQQQQQQQHCSYSIVD